MSGDAAQGGQRFTQLPSRFGQASGRQSFTLGRRDLKHTLYR